MKNLVRYALIFAGGVILGNFLTRRAFKKQYVVVDEGKEDTEDVAKEKPEEKEKKIDDTEVHDILENVVRNKGSVHRRTESDYTDYATRYKSVDEKTYDPVKEESPEDDQPEDESYNSGGYLTKERQEKEGVLEVIGPEDFGSEDGFDICDLFYYIQDESLLAEDELPVGNKELLEYVKEAADSLVHDTGHFKGDWQMYVRDWTAGIDYEIIIVDGLSPYFNDIPAGKED